MQIHPLKQLHGRRPISRCCLVALQTVIIGLGLHIAQGQDEPFRNDLQGVEVLTRGPVHEAFAGIVSFDPEPGIIVDKAPPDPIEEIPPTERPEGDNVSWIPGYWAWDDELSDFLWVSGMWRALPPGREWIFGYWADVTTGYQWTSGYWADSTAQETVYLPQPPRTLERGPNVAAPSSDYGWTPGSWVWIQDRYAWGPGYWNQGRTDWDWMPAHYVWTPRGYIFVDGYWDYNAARRGVLFAPVYFQPNVYAQRGYSYAPSIALNLVAVIQNLFLRPRYHHYYFGDYYAPSYQNSGFYSPFGYQSTRYGYDPIYSQQRWQHRDDRGWEDRFQNSYIDRRDHESARPPRTWIDQRGLNFDSNDSRHQHSMIATPFDQLAKGKGSPIRFQPVADKERQQFAEHRHDVKKYRDDRQKQEGRGPKSDDRGPDDKASTVTSSRSPIVGKKSSELSKVHAPPPPHREQTAIPGAPTKRPGPDGRPSVEPPKGKPQDKPGNPRERMERPETAPDQPPTRGRETVPGRPAATPKGKPQPQVRPEPDNSPKMEKPKSEPDKAAPRGKEKAPEPSRAAEPPKGRPQPQARPEPGNSPKTEKPKSEPDKAAPRGKEKALEPSRAAEPPKGRPQPQARPEPGNSPKTEKPKSEPDKATPRGKEKALEPSRAAEPPKARPQPQVRPEPGNSPKTEKPKSEPDKAAPRGKEKAPEPSRAAEPPKAKSQSQPEKPGKESKRDKG